MRWISFLFIILFLSTSLVQAQSLLKRKRAKQLLASFGTGFSSYFGELNNQRDKLDTKLNIDGGLQMQVYRNLHLRANILWFQLEGNDVEADDDGRAKRNLSFRSNNFELSFTGTISLFDDGYRYYQRKNINPFLSFGLGVTWFNPAAKLDGTWYLLRPLKTEGTKYGPFTVVIPFGAGMKFKASNFINFAIEGLYRITFTDYLDDVSTNYIDQSSFSDPLASSLADRRPEISLPPRPAGNKRGNPNQKDGYFILSLKGEYYIPYGKLFKAKKRKGKIKRPKFR